MIRRRKKKRIMLFIFVLLLANLPMGAIYADSTNPPAQASQMSATNGSASIIINWTNPLDADFSHVNIYRDTVLIASNIVGTSYNDTTVAASTSYTYSVETEDTFGNKAVGKDIYAATEYLPKNTSAGLFDNEIWVPGPSTGITNEANATDDEFGTFALMQGGTGYMTFSFMQPHNISSAFVSFSGMQKPILYLYDNTSTYITQMALSNGLNNFATINGVAHMELHEQSGTVGTRVYEFEAFSPYTPASTSFGSGHLSYETWVPGASAGITNYQNMFDNSLGSFASLVGPTNAENSSYQTIEFSKLQMIDSVYVNFNGPETPYLMFYGASYDVLGKKYFPQGGFVLKTSIPNVKYVEVYGIKQQRPIDILEVELYGPNITAPDEVSGLNNSKTTSTVTLNWVNPPNGDFNHVNVYRDTVLVGSNITTGTFTDSGRTPGTTHTYKVTTLDFASNESTGVTQNVTTNGGLPSNVINLQESHGQTTASLTWDSPPSGPYDYFEVYRDGNKIGDNIVVNSFNDSGLQRGKTYQYKVVTVSGVDSSSGGIINITTDGRLHVGVPSISSFGSLVLNGVEETLATTFGGALLVEDTTNNGSGWSLTVQATPFQQSGGMALVFPSGSLTLKAPDSISKLNGTTSINPSVFGSGPWVIDVVGAVKILSAAVGEGMGEYGLNMPIDALTLHIPEDIPLVDPADGAPGTTFQSTITFTIVSGP